ncbi:MAG: sensor domain-containing diguanylate cyclase [Treponema sp.]|jgi:diguanylate cyclase (GGDEF)-like protein|nr:sensor domain-containing diguanylate cyclase [Treponema sp.]
MKKENDKKNIATNYSQNPDAAKPPDDEKKPEEAGQKAIFPPHAKTVSSKSGSLKAPQIEEEFLSNPKIVENYSFLQEIGIFKHIDNLNREIRNYKSLLSGGLDIFNRTSIDEIMDATVWQISDHFLPSFLAFLWKPIQNKDEITIKAYKNYKPVDINIKMDSISPFEAFFQQYPKPINFDLLAFELKNDEAVKPLEEVRSEIIIPILGPFGLYGIIVVGRKILEDEYTQEELVFLQQLMAFVSQAIKNHLHYEHSLRDVKTGLYNHGFFMTRINEEVARTKRTGYTSSLIVMDVDKFKNFNDNFGHMAGDRVLESIAFMIKQTVRTEDIPSRFGGEEFTVLLPSTEKGTAWAVAERLRTSIAGMKVPWEPPLPQVTISLGLYTFDRHSEISAEEILSRADEALYLSKERGRNRTTIWGSGLLFRIQQKSKKTTEAVPKLQFLEQQP